MRTTAERNLCRDASYVSIHINQFKSRNEIPRTHNFHNFYNFSSQIPMIIQKENAKAWKEKGNKMKNWKKITSVVACVALVGALGSGAGIYEISADTRGTGENMPGRSEQTETDGNSFTEEGTTSMSTVSQMPEFSLGRALMYVEEVYVSAGDTVSEGDALFKIAEESMEDAKAYYEKAVKNAKDTLTEAENSYESGKLDASYIKLDAETAAAGAAATLESALAELDAEIEEKYKKWQDTAYLIAAYHDNFYNNIYYTNSGILEKDTAANTAQEAYNTAQAAYNAAGITYETAKQNFDTAVAELATVAAGNGDGTVTMEEAANQVVAHYNVLSTVEPLYNEAERTSRELQQAKQALEQAKTNYEKTVENAEKTLEQLEGSVDALEQNYETANREAETKRLELQKQYDTAVLEGEYAQTTYNATVETLYAAVESAQKSLDTLLEEQEALLALEDGVVCANRAGTIASVSYEADDILFSGNAFVTYYETDTLTISVEVEQENIAKVAVGDEVRVEISGSRRSNITGKVVSVASSATTGRSVSDVTYAVVIAIENERNMLSAGSSATLTFEYGE